MHMDLSFDAAGIESEIAAATALGVEGGPIRRPKLLLSIDYLALYNNNSSEGIALGMYDVVCI
jgi:hypothetical protein